jgi:hypothetical protein
MPRGPRIASTSIVAVGQARARICSSAAPKKKAGIEPAYFIRESEPPSLALCATSPTAAGEVQHDHSL